jgi:hypothetical protein
MDSTEALVSELRLRIGERIPSPGGEGDTLFSNSELESVIVASETMLQATVLAWQFKAAELSRLVDVAEADSSRKLSQRFKHAQQMASVWGAKLLVDEGAALRVSVVGQPISYLRDNTITEPELLIVEVPRGDW